MFKLAIVSLFFFKVKHILRVPGGQDRAAVTRPLRNIDKDMGSNPAAAKQKPMV